MIASTPKATQAMAGPLRRGITALLLTTVCLSLLSGCRGDGDLINGGHGRLVAPLGTISIYQLAGRLDLTVTENTRLMATLANSSNVIVVYGDPGGGVYVNGRSIGAVGPVTPVGEMLFVQAATVGQVRSALRAVRRTRPATPAPAPAKVVTAPIIIDPGHGGKDPGTISASGIQEKAVVLDAALSTAEMLAGQNVPVVMTRRGDKFIELNDRAEVANRSRAKMFVSIHADSCPKPSLRGFTVYVAKSASKASMALARSIHRRMAAAGATSRGIRKANFRVLVRTTCPAVLVELGYLSNASEATKLASRKYRRRLAAAIAEGVLDHLRGPNR